MVVSHTRTQHKHTLHTYRRGNLKGISRRASLNDGGRGHPVASQRAPGARRRAFNGRGARYPRRFAKIHTCGARNVRWPSEDISGYFLRKMPPPQQNEISPDVRI